MLKIDRSYETFESVTSPLRDPDFKPLSDIRLGVIDAEPAAKFPQINIPQHNNNVRVVRQGLVIGALILASLLCWSFISNHVLTLIQIQGRSMNPTLKDGDQRILNRWHYIWNSPKRFDLVVLKDPGHTDLAVKRIVGVPNDTIRISEGSIYVNGEKLKEQYLQPGTETLTPDGREELIVVGAGRYFVLGDNRNMSEDSRYYGTVRRRDVIGYLPE